MTSNSMAVSVVSLLLSFFFSTVTISAGQCLSGMAVTPEEVQIIDLSMGIFIFLYYMTFCKNIIY